MEPTTDFRLYLQNELIRRCQKNPHYSLRAFARTLQIEASALSKILNAKRAVTPEMLTKLGLKLGLGRQELKNFKGIKGALGHLDFDTVDADQFKIISDWYHYAILELTAVEDFRPNTKWIAKRLGITASEANIAVERLTRAGFLKIEKNRWTDVSGNLTTVGNNFTISAFRNLQRQILQMAVQSLEETPMERRDQTSMTMAIDSKLLPQAKEKIKKFRRDMDRLLQSSDTKDEVYHLSVALYPVTKTTDRRSP